MRVVSRAVLGIVFLLLPVATFAQGAIAGQVKDASGAVLPGVTVEAASPVLIEKTRTAVSDGSGNYRIENLRPGSYTVTFTLAGFSTVKRDGVDVNGTSVTTADAMLRVGAVAETITVTGEAPLVDVSSTKKEVVLDADTVQSLPSSRQYFTLARVAPGTTGGGSDVGGAGIADVGQSLTVHGSKAVDQRVMLNGLSIMTLQAGGNIGGQQPDVGSAAEIAVDTTSLSAEMSTGGIRINFIPKDGGNTFSNSTFFTFANQSMQGNNYTDALKAAGLPTPTQIDNTWDLNESLGGPIMHDKVWFFFSTRFNRANAYAGIFANANAYNPNAWTYVPDTSQPAENRGKVQQNNLRLTWQASPKIKIAGEQKMDAWCNCPTFIGVNGATLRAPEAANDRRFPRLRQEHVEFTSPVTDKFLFEAVGMHLFERWGNMDLRDTSNGGSLTTAQAAAIQNMISVTEQSNGLIYRSYAATPNGGLNNTLVPNYTYRVAGSYVTGTHTFKAGWNDTFGHLDTYNYAYQPTSYTFLNGSPTSITEYAAPFLSLSNENHDFGMFAQDSWRLNRTTVMGAIRYDWFKTGFPAQTIGPGSPVVGLGNRNLSFPAADNLDWKDITYRMGAVWDPRGDGKSAVKVAANKYLLGQTLNGFGLSPNPVNALQTFTTRSWADSNHNFQVDCNLANPAAQNNTGTGGDNCGAIANNAFGTAIPGATFDPDLLTGWGHRPANWEFSGSIQQQLPRRMSVEVGYYRRIWENFPVVDNLLAGPNDFQQFTMTVPTDPRLPGGGGNQLTYYNINPNKFGQTQNYNTLSDKYGYEYEHWNGVDVSVSGRLQNGLRFQAGTSTGHTVADNCAVVAQLPEMLSNGPANAGGTAAAGPQLAKEFCHLQEPWLTNFKALVVYTVPKVDVQLAVTIRSVPGLANTNGNGAGGAQPSGVAANFVATNAYLGTNSNLGRLLTGTTSATQNTTLQIINPDTVYLDRDNQVDFRVGKVLKYRGIRAAVNLDLYNLTNASTILSANAAYALTNNAWLTPTSISNPRLLKISFTLDLR
ncbi:MAG TPA: TonB-dependent receptor [Vicinamibacterales bacterium]|nr:TonB-dependent receptor [Vicinamibacterales bacterium]